MVAVRKDYAAPTELENLMIPISTNMPRLTALGRRARSATPKTVTGTSRSPAKTKWVVYFSPNSDSKSLAPW